MRTALLVGVAAVATFAGAGSGHAEGVTGAQLRALAVRAAHDPTAAAQLARVDRVDGRPG